MSRAEHPFAASALPLHEADASALDDALRARVAAHWERRAQAEHRVGRLFAALLPRLADVGAHETVLALCASAMDEEARHAEVCVALADAYRGTPRDVAFAFEGLPSFGYDGDFEVLLLVAAASCIQESLAVAWLRASADEASTGLARAAHRGHLREEVSHARLGWAHLASPQVTKPMKDALAEWLGPMLEANVPSWEAADPDLPAAGVDGHGLLSRAQSLAAVREGLTTLVLPGFAHVGVDTTGAQAWLNGRGAMV